MSERTTTIGDELAALRDKSGVVHPSEAVTWARSNKKSMLHASLTWDDEIAGERYRIWQVRSLISVHITDAEGERRFVSLSIDRAGAGGYREVGAVMSSVELREVMIADALEELKRVQKRFDRLTELQGVWAEADKVAAKRPVRKAAA